MPHPNERVFGRIERVQIGFGREHGLFGEERGLILHKKFDGGDDAIFVGIGEHLNGLETFKSAVDEMRRGFNAFEAISARKSAELGSVDVPSAAAECQADQSEPAE